MSLRDPRNRDTQNSFSFIPRYLFQTVEKIQDKFEQVVGSIHKDALCDY